MERTSRHLGRDLEPWRISKGVQVKMEAQTKLTSSMFRSPGPVYTKMVAQVAYVLVLGRSLYGWKDSPKNTRIKLRRRIGKTSIRYFKLVLIIAGQLIALIMLESEQLYAFFYLFVATLPSTFVASHNFPDVLFI
uniref:Uncharacterized protein n=1 Tax=Oryza sativa subsp. japonica TaxID=39947 RepID=Q651J8_ORYSJ|nr:hypothetical protein [Oryza sativa Japonica Group]BAD46519.1 hypothetical protein [Oryza sativa Japonica Group]